ncbi:MAG: 2-C-methyl-D-erythritol 4-phosphate cytidylyltransferase [Chlorobi bacterium]|nr:2-C-methyl-D-erythritol 4-phosphate cytidylyltransferase [Chlorobiota bacterium]
MTDGVIIVAGGTGERTGEKIPKQFINLGGYPVLWHTISAFYRYQKNLSLILVLHPSWISYWFDLSNKFPHMIPCTIVEGGSTRADSVYNGLKEASAFDFVAVHDAARPFLREPFLKRVFKEAHEKGNAIPVLPVSESVRKITRQSNKTVDRNTLYFVQTPQVFRTNELKKAFNHPDYSSFTDEASLMEQSGIRIHPVDGDPLNIKITYPEDLKMAECLLKSL